MMLSSSQRVCFLPYVILCDLYHKQNHREDLFVKAVFSITIKIYLEFENIYNYNMWLLLTLTVQFLKNHTEN